MSAVQLPASNKAFSTSDPNGTIIDRSIYAKLPDSINEDGVTSCEYSPRSTPSARHGIPPFAERLHRLHGTSLILDVSTLLHLPPSAYATACVIFHRLYHRISLTRYCVWSAAMACMFLAGKVEEEPRTARSIILVFAHVYRRRRLRVGDDVTRYSYGASDCETDGALTLTEEEKENMIRSVKPMSTGGAVYAEWRDVLFEMESVILETLGFTLHWIPDSHPHKFILYFVRVLEIESKEIVQRAWNYCNHSCRLDLCVRYDPELIACAAILLASSDHNVDLPLTPRHWWEVFVGPNCNQDLSLVCNSILALDDENDLVIRRSKYAFIPSLVNERSFNDVESYLWSVTD